MAVKRSGWTVSLTVTAVAVMAMLLMASLILTLGWMGARSALVLTATRTASDSGELINERARRMLEPVQATIRQIGFDPLTSANTLSQRLDRLYVLADELTANTLLSALYVGYSNGEFFLVRSLDNAGVRALFKAPPRASFLVQARSKQANGSILGEFIFYTVDSVMLERRVVPEYQFDPRTRPWYKSGNETNTTVLSDPYVFFSTRQIGLTVSQLARSTEAVVGVDMVLDELSAALGDLRVTPNAQIALVNDRNEVLAYPDMSRTIREADGKITFNTVAQMGVPSLVQLNDAAPPLGAAHFFESLGQRTLGIVLPFKVWESKNFRLLITVPEAELMGSLIEQGKKLLLLVLALVLMLLPLGWMAGSRVGRSLSSLTRFAARLGRFDFTLPKLQHSFIHEVNSLNAVMSDMRGTIQGFLSLSRQMASEPNLDRMIDQVLDQLLSATRCEAAAVYLWNHTQGRMARNAASGYPDSDFCADFAYPEGRESALAMLPLAPGLAVKTIELRGRTGQLQGLLLLVHQDDQRHADASFMEFADQLSGMLAVSIETRQLIDAQKKLLDSVVRLMADANDAKSPYTGGHCERVPQLAIMLTDRMIADTTGPYAHFSMTAEERDEFRLGAWLHDCGKVTSPEHIVDKATKLEVIYNRIHEIRMRFEVLLRDAENDHLQRQLAGIDTSQSRTLLQARQAQLQADFVFVAQCNVGGEFMADDAIARLKDIGRQTWLRHFDNRLGLSTEESRRLTNAEPEAAVLPALEHLLRDRPEHVVPWGERKPAVEKGDPRNHLGFDMVLPANQQNMGELHNLSIRRGTLTDEDRFKINDHIVQTLVMLSGLPWPEHLARVPDIAGSHHEKMDGQGYPRRLSADRLTPQDRVMALVDVFEALTAADRPYKAPKTLSESLRIMAFMCKDKHLDPELFRYFLQSGMWQTFAERFLSPGQHDAVDVAALEKMLPPPPV